MIKELKFKIEYFDNKTINMTQTLLNMAKSLDKLGYSTFKELNCNNEWIIKLNKTKKWYKEFSNTKLSSKDLKLKEFIDSQSPIITKEILESMQKEQKEYESIGLPNWDDIIVNKKKCKCIKKDEY